MMATFSWSRQWQTSFISLSFTVETI